MNDTDLRLLVEEEVENKISAEEAFTTADISHPIIKRHNDVRHREVKTIIENLESRGTMAVADYETTNIKVFPKGPGSSGVTARLWHPENYDVDDYKGGHKVLVRGQPATTADQGVVAIFDNDSTPALAQKSTTPTNAVITKHVTIQHKNCTLNIPAVVVQAAGWNKGDRFIIVNGGATMTIQLSAIGKQAVDKEGRIRIHGTNAYKSKSTDVSVIDDPNGCFISLS